MRVPLGILEISRQMVCAPDIKSSMELTGSVEGCRKELV